MLEDSDSLSHSECVPLHLSYAREVGEEDTSMYRLVSALPRNSNYRSMHAMW